MARLKRVTDKIKAENKVKRKPRKYQPRECVGCGNDKPERLTPCPHCGTNKCERCDAGDDVECGNCPPELFE